MKKFGFTLPEILIALAVVGIVAALVIPSLVTDVNDQTNASRLSSSVNDLEIAFKQMMDEDEVDDIGRTTSGFFSPSASDMIDAISQHLKVLNIDTSVANFSSWYVDSGNFRFQTINGTNDTWSFAQPNPDGFTPHNVYFMLKNGAIVVMSGFIGRNLNETDLRCQRVMIDVNGKERPNMYGRDVFAFTMDRDGSLIPFGTMGRWRNSSSNNDERCILTNSNNFSGSGLGCTARLMGNNYKMDY